MDRFFLPLLFPFNVWCFWTYTHGFGRDFNSVALPWLYLGVLVGPSYLLGKHYDLYRVSPLPRVAIGFSRLSNIALSVLLWRIYVHTNGDDRIWYSARVYLLADTCLVLLISLLCHALVQVLAAPPVLRRNADMAGLPQSPRR